MVNNSPLTPSFGQFMTDFGDDLRMNTFNAIPGKIDVYDPKTGSASIDVMMSRKDAQTGQIKQWAGLLDVPVMQLSGAAGGVNIPIAQGDDCLVIFADRDIDNWYATGAAQVPASPRIHSLADGFAIVGVRPLTKPPIRPDYLATGIYRDATQISIKGNKVAVKNGTTDLKAILDAIISHIDSISVIAPSGGGPCTVTFSSATTAPSGLLYAGDSTTP